MLCIIFWKALPETIPEILKLTRSGKLVTSPEVKTYLGYVTPEDLYVKTIEAKNEALQQICYHVVAKPCK
jgi:hypothetical protein